MESTAIVKPKRRLVKFSSGPSKEFFEDVKLAVNQYFKSNGISQNADNRMRVKTAVMLSLYFIPFALILSSGISHMGWAATPVLYLSWILMGFGVVGIGTSVMHDSNHGSYTDSKGPDKILGGLLNFIGGYAPNWRIQHNILHHTYTNITGLDEDIDPSALIRLSPHKPLLKMHRYQYIYGWFLYCLMNLFWITVKDYRLLVRYNGHDLLRKEKLTLRKGLLEVTALKLLYLCTTLFAPLAFSGMPWYHVVGGFVLMHVMAGFGLAAIFQPAHVLEHSQYPTPNADLKIENNWAVHQMYNTTNFAMNNKLLSWYIGGLNFQIEHHLFPYICHVHYPALSPIVQDIAKKHNIPYFALPTFRSALYEHGKMLKILGRKPMVSEPVFAN